MPHKFNDLVVIADPSSKLLKALKIIGEDLHRLASKVPNLRHQDISKESCVWSSLIVKDYLNALGFEAKVRPVIFEITNCPKDNKSIYRRVTIGHPDDENVTKGRWRGHLVVSVENFIIDTTLYQVIRPEWKWFPPMLVVPLYDKPIKSNYGDRLLIAGLVFGKPISLAAFWVDDPENTTWHKGPDAKPDRRQKIVHKLLVKSSKENII